MRLLIDVSGLLYKAAYTQDLTDPKGRNVGIVFGTLKLLERIAKSTQATEMVICWDGGSAKRKAIYSGYKANRQRDPEFVDDFNRQSRLLATILNYLPVVQIGVPDVEADDSIAVLCKFLRHEHVGIVTGDKDLYQLARPPDHVIVNSKGRVVELDLEPHQYLAYAVLVGKGSNTLPGIPRVGDKTARALLAEHRTLTRILDVVFESPSGKLGSLSHSQARKVIKRNLKLMRLGVLLDKDETGSILDQYKHGRLDRRIDEKTLRAHFKNLGFVSFLRRFSAFLIPFRDMERHGKAEAERGAVREAGADANRICKAGEGSEQYAKRIRQPVAAGRDKGKRREATRGRRSRAEGATSRVGRTAGRRAEQAAETLRAPTQPTDVYYPRVRAVASPGNAGRRKHGGRQRAVRPNPVRPAGQGVEARSGRVRQPLARLFASEKVAGKRKGRRQEAVHSLLTFNDKEGWVWLRRQPAETLRFISSLCDSIDSDKSFSPTKEDLRRLAKVREEYLNEPADWMVK